MFWQTISKGFGEKHLARNWPSFSHGLVRSAGIHHRLFMDVVKPWWAAVIQRFESCWSGKAFAVLTVGCQDR
jgi:hypothetical protein